MIISIKGGGVGTGYGAYVLRENESSKSLENIKVLKGDMQLGDSIVESSNYKDNAFNIVLSFKGEISEDKATAVLEDFEELFMAGFEKHEYHLDAVMHQDTDNHHIHIRIPKRNLFTNTTLRLYMDKVDRNRVNLIRDHLEYKYELDAVVENTKLAPISKATYIEKWRDERGEKPFDFSKKKGREEAQKYIVNYIVERHEAGFINSIGDVRAVLKELELEPNEKQGHDFKTDTYYITVANESGKIRLKGELFNERFFEYTREDRSQQIGSGTSIRRAEQCYYGTDTAVSAKLEKVLQHRRKEVSKRYKESRARAIESHRKLLIQSTSEPSRSEQRERDEQQLSPHQELTNSHNNTVNRVDSSKLFQRKSKSKPMGDTREVSGGTRERAKIYGYTKSRFAEYKRRTKGLFGNKQRGINGTIGNGVNGLRETRAREFSKRKSTYESFRETRNSLYQEARGTMQNRANRRGRRERFGEKVGHIGEAVGVLKTAVSSRYREVDRQSSHLIQAVERIIKSAKIKVANREATRHETPSYRGMTR